MTQEIMNIKEEVSKIIRDEITKEVQRESYQKGLIDGQSNKIDGMELAWEAARKLTHPSYGGYYDDEKLEIFGYRNSDDVLTMLSASEAISRIKEYEEEQAKISEEQKEKNIQKIFGTEKHIDNEIRVGDEVNNDYCRGVVVGIMQSGVRILWANHKNTYWRNSHVKEILTGRHFDAIEDVLEQMRENDND